MWRLDRGDTRLTLRCCIGEFAVLKAAAGLTLCGRGPAVGCRDCDGFPSSGRCCDNAVQLWARYLVLAAGLMLT